MQIEMTYVKSTKNTHVYAAAGTAIPQLYIQKDELEAKPAKIRVTVEAL